MLILTLIYSNHKESIFDEPSEKRIKIKPIKNIKLLNFKEPNWFLDFMIKQLAMNPKIIICIGTTNLLYISCMTGLIELLSHLNNYSKNP